MPVGDFVALENCFLRSSFISVIQVFMKIHLTMLELFQILLIVPMATTLYEALGRTVTTNSKVFLPGL